MQANVETLSNGPYSKRLSAFYFSLNLDTAFIHIYSPKNL